MANLKRELAELKEAVRKDEQKQQTDHTRITQTVKELTAKEEHDWRTTRRDMETEFAKRCLVVQHEAFAERVQTNERALKETAEIMNRQNSNVERKIQANADGDNEFAQEMKP